MSGTHASFCPICSETYEQKPYRFCPVDGTPLMAVPSTPALARSPEPVAVAMVDTPMSAAMSKLTPTRRARVTTGSVKPSAAVAPQAVAPARQPVEVERPAEGADMPTRIERIPELRGARQTESTASSAGAEQAPPRFPETDWFNRPPGDDEIDPESGRVLVDTSAYRRVGAGRPGNKS